MVLPFATKAFSPGFSRARGSSYFNPPGPVLLRLLVRTEQPAGPPRGNSRPSFTRSLTYPVCPENEIRVTPIGICRHIMRLCWSCFTIVEMSCNRDSESDRVVLGEGISFVDCECLSWAKLGHPCRVLSFESRARGYEADGNLLLSGCKELVT